MGKARANCQTEKLRQDTCKQTWSMIPLMQGTRHTCHVKITITEGNPWLAPPQHADTLALSDADITRPSAANGKKQDDDGPGSFTHFNVQRCAAPRQVACYNDILASYWANPWRSSRSQPIELLAHRARLQCSANWRAAETSSCPAK